MDELDYICCLSGVEPEEGTLLSDETADDLGIMPEGWTRITIERRLPNPKWHMIQEVKQGSVEAALQQVDEKDRDGSRPVIEVQVAAQYAALEANIAPFVNTKEVVYVAPPEFDEAMSREFYGIREKLGLPVPAEDNGSDPSGESGVAEAAS